MRRDYTPDDRLPAAYRWVRRIEAESGIRDLIGFRWRVDMHGVSECDTSWMLAYVCPHTWRTARSMVLRAIAGVKTRPGVTLLARAPEADRERARVALQEPPP